ncbi:c-type cytochrome [Sulfurovum sp. ST-21]|uniref:Cytochrome c n=1 Tax=Sulfurovum indicum TaxID=2779528 RepID=A0A7M1S2K7_9BACT|nr:cytochrome c [Sulfurovum indicum]QOR61657.1 cytochrome c [Sulfurovum indicum]HIP17991.1 cytochrome c [Sulfurovum sp.]
MKQITILLSLLLGTELLADIEKGKAAYTANCAICHTVNGGRAMGPDFNIVSYTRTKEEIQQYAENPSSLYRKFGYSANAMPTLPLNEDDLSDIAEYISSLQPFKKWMVKKKI